MSSPMSLFYFVHTRSSENGRALHSTPCQTSRETAKKIQQWRTREPTSPWASVEDKRAVRDRLVEKNKIVTSLSENPEHRNLVRGIKLNKAAREEDSLQRKI